MINIYGNFLSDEDMLTCNKIIRGTGWGFGFKSDVKENLTPLPPRTDYGTENIPFWKLPLGDQEFFTNQMFEIIKKRTEMDFELLEVYCNGQTYGQDGHPHLDNVWGETHTFLYYANPGWNLTWGGKTVFLDLEENKKAEIDPIPNRAILFTTDLMHYGEAFNQFCRDLRTTVCYKLKEK